MTGRISYCRACMAQVEWIDGKAYNFEGLGKRGSVHMSTCSNPDYFKKKPEKNKLTQYEKRQLGNQWWQK